MFWIFPPSKKPTPSEYVVLVAFVSLGLIILGTVALVMGFRAPPEKHEIAVALEHRGAWCVAAGLVIPFVIWFFRRLLD